MTITVEAHRCSATIVLSEVATVLYHQDNSRLVTVILKNQTQLDLKFKSADRASTAYYDLDRQIKALYAK